MSKKEELFIPMNPLIMGSLNLYGGIPYPKREIVTLRYNTNKKAIQNILPDCYTSTDPNVTVSFVYNDGVQDLAYRGYNIATFQVPALYEGEQNTVEGSYSIVMYEDNTTPIIGGREVIGIPKLYSEISPIRLMPDGRLRCEASIYGYLLFGIEVEAGEKQGESVVDAWNAGENVSNLLGYKYVPSLEGPPDCAYPILTPSEICLKELWNGNEGRLYFGDVGVYDVGQHSSVVAALKTLEVNKILGVSHSFSSTKLRVDKAYRLL
jgi:acetoacetate decarboxylase